jgi:hypothetical protein
MNTFFDLIDSIQSTRAGVPTGAIGVIKSIGLTLSRREGLTPSSGLTNPYFVPFRF